MSGMDQPHSGNDEESVGVRDDLRCKRSDGKQWRCTAMSMPDKTVCEKHYVQAKKRAASSAMRANLKKLKRKPTDETEDDDEEGFDIPIIATVKKTSKVPKHPLQYSPKTSFEGDVGLIGESWKPHDTPSLSTKNKSGMSFDTSPVTEYSDGSTDPSVEIGGQTCHQCHRNNRERVVWCFSCNERGYCDNCISKWYPGIPLDEIEKICPACRGSCNCKLCLRADNLIKLRIKEIPVLDKLNNLHSLLSSVLPVVKLIHQQQCAELELEKKLRGTDIDLARARLNADEQMCCNVCRIPIIDYYRHCGNCSYDLCINCCQDLRVELSDNKNCVGSQDDDLRLNFLDKFPGWKANSDNSIPCPPEEFGGCGNQSLNLGRIFKMNWVAKLVKKVEEMVNGCKVSDSSNPQNSGLNDSIGDRGGRDGDREGSDDSVLYCPSYEDIRTQGIVNIKTHWARGQPVIVKLACDSLSASSWNPDVIWRGIRDIADDNGNDEQLMVKAIDCLDGSEVDIELFQFIQGYSEGRIRENGVPEMLQLKDWPSRSLSEEFLLYRRPEFISKLPLLEYIHSRLGVLNVAAKLPHYSLQNDVGPKFYISYGMYPELGRGDSVTCLHYNMRDMVYLLMHTCEANAHKTKISKTNKTTEEIKSPSGGSDAQNEYGRTKDEEMGTISPVEDKCVHISEENCAGSHWDVFRRQDVPKLNQYLRKHQKDFCESAACLKSKVKIRPLFEKGIFLSEHDKMILKEEFGVEPWSIKQYVGDAIFIPAGCPFQMRNLQSTVQLGLDFIFPESIGEALNLAQEIRCLPNDHEAKLQILEVGKISLYAASSAIKEVEKLVLDPKLCRELGFEDPNLTAAVSENLENAVKQAQISCP